MELKGKTAIVTGGTRGIGKAICEELLNSKCEVIITGTKKQKPAWSKKDGIEYLQLDLLKQNSIDYFLKRIKGLKGVDILVNNAGINIIESIEDLKKKSWRNIIEVNLEGPMVLCKEVSKLMKKNENGRILNISSIWGVISKEKRVAYSASKTGLIGLTRAMSLDLAPYNILVNSICPGFTMTELTKSTLSDTEIKNLSKDIPLKRFASVEEIAKTAVFLCSDLNTYITGQSIVVDGGFTIR
jgi:3-oxoacyl-[acyl-carrier protein] reductase